MDNLEILPDEYMIPADVYTPIIPRILHMIWVGDAAPPANFLQFANTWGELMPQWTIRIWRNEDITIDEFPELIVKLIGWSNKGVQKADIMKWFVMEKYGGVYIDADVTPHRSLEDLIIHTNRSAVLCHDLPVTWQYMACGFFAAVPHHPLFKRACELCYSCTVNTPDIHMQTGPRLLGEAVWTTSTEEKYLLLPIHYFYRNDTFPYRFGTHTYDKNW